MRGRPTGSVIRNRICQILKRKKFSYGYEIYNIYKRVFGEVSIESIYYHLKKGVQTGEILLARVRKEIGNFTWGPETERVYYTLGPYAEPANEKIPHLYERELEYDLSKRMDEELKKIREKVNKKKISKKEREKIKNRLNSLIEFCKLRKMERDYLVLLQKTKNKLYDSHTP